MGACSIMLPSVIILYSSSRTVFTKGQDLSMSIYFVFSVYKVSDIRYKRFNCSKFFSGLSNAKCNSLFFYRCFGKMGFSTFKIRNNDTQVIMDDTLGLVADAASFTSEDNGVTRTYFVTVGRMADGEYDLESKVVRS